MMIIFINSVMCTKHGGGRGNNGGGTRPARPRKRGYRGRKGGMMAAVETGAGGRNALVPGSFMAIKCIVPRPKV
jgi:hypothetical protein